MLWRIVLLLLNNIALVSYRNGIGNLAEDSSLDRSLVHEDTLILVDYLNGRNSLMDLVADYVYWLNILDVAKSSLMRHELWIYLVYWLGVLDEKLWLNKHLLLH